MRSHASYGEAGINNTLFGSEICVAHSKMTNIYKGAYQISNGANKIIKH